MATVDEDEDELLLVKASQTLLAELEDGIPKLLWKPSKSGVGYGKVHTRVKSRQLARVTGTIDQFQGDPQLLDTWLKQLVPPVVDAYLQALSSRQRKCSGDHVDLQTAACNILYTFCKVRGPKVITGFLNNEPQHLEPVLEALEGTLCSDGTAEGDWRVPYILLLWLSHLLLAPFDLSTISTRAGATSDFWQDKVVVYLPPLVKRVLRVAFVYLPSSTKAQDAAAAMLVRLVARPDMQKLRLADSVTTYALTALSNDASDVPRDMYERIGPLRFLAGVATSADLSYLVPNIYKTCETLANTDHSTHFTSNAVAKKLLVKVLRNVALLALRSASTPSELTFLLEEGGLLEEVIDYLLRSLGDRDTPVRYAAAKAISLVVLELDPEMGHQIIQALLDEFKADASLGFQSADALKWHGLTLAMSHTLFKRSAAVEQLPDILNSLTMALNFEQRTSTGSAVGTNVRDAACFGIWSVSRRYTTDELLAVDVSALDFLDNKERDATVIQILAIQLLQSACLDPAGNIRRGSSAALQELIGRHPNNVHEGIALVQIVDYQAVGLRRRAMIDVAEKASALDAMYWIALVGGTVAWRGLGSPDVSSREAAAASLGMMSTKRFYEGSKSSVTNNLWSKLAVCGKNDTALLHGILLAFAMVLQHITSPSIRPSAKRSWLSQTARKELWKMLDSPAVKSILHRDFNASIIRAELPAAAGKLVAELSKLELPALERRNTGSEYHVDDEEHHPAVSFDLSHVEMLLERLLARHEQTILAVIDPIVKSQLQLRRAYGAALGCIGAQALITKVAADGMKSIPHGSGRAIALGVLSTLYDNDAGVVGEKGTNAILTICKLASAPTIEWRIVCQRALLNSIQTASRWTPEVGKAIADAVSVGLNDYTIDERGDVGSLVRIKALATAEALLISGLVDPTTANGIELNVIQLSFEKLDRVRLPAARLRKAHSKELVYFGNLDDVPSVSTYEYFVQAIKPLAQGDEDEDQRATVLAGLVSCAGVGAENLLQASRAALTDVVEALPQARLLLLMNNMTNLLRCYLPNAQVVANSPSTYSAISNSGRDMLHPTLEVIAYILTTNVTQRLSSGDFSWRNLLSNVQKAHYKSSDIPRLMSCLSIYHSMLSCDAVRADVLKKLCSMLATNPYPKVRIAVAEVLWSGTGVAELKGSDWGSKEAKELSKSVGAIVMSG
ncbi:hypothetical protein MBLNU230_g1722t1 [Neophaeotheca triangularis]